MISVAVAKAESAARVARMAMVAHKRDRKNGALVAICYHTVCSASQKNMLNIDLPPQGVMDEMMTDLARCGRSKTDPNICRNLHRLLERKNRLFPVKVSYVSTMIRKSRKQPMLRVQYPVLNMSSWAQSIFSRGGHFFMQGGDLDNLAQFQNTLQLFWERWGQTDPNFGFLRDFPKSEWRSAIPVALHGDEGRGRLKKPVMILSLQPVLPLLQSKTNMQG